VIDDGYHHQFEDFDDLPEEVYVLYFKNVSGTWSLNPRIFLTRDMAEYIGKFYDRPTYIIPVTFHAPERLVKKAKKIRKPKVRKPKVRKVRMPR